MGEATSGAKNIMPKPKIVVEAKSKQQPTQPDIREVIVTDTPDNLKLMMEIALMVYRANGLIFAIVDYNDIADAKLPTLANKPLSRDPAELKNTLRKYVNGVELHLKVGNRGIKSFIIGKGGRKVKKLARYLGIKIIVD